MHFLNENLCILINVLLVFAHNGQIYNKSLQLFTKKIIGLDYDFGPNRR